MARRFLIPDMIWRSAPTCRNRPRRRRRQKFPLPHPQRPSPSLTPVATPTPGAPCVSTGDVNQDGQVTPGDAQQAFFFYIDCAGLNPTALEYCMANYCGTGSNTPCDGSVTLADALGILKIYLGMPDPCA